MAKFFVNRGGGRAPEGPFEEADIIRLIAAKKLVSADICRVGALRFQKLAEHPPFAQALRGVGVEVPLQVARPRASVAPKSAGRGLLLAAVLCIFGLGIAAVSIGSYVMFSNGATPIRAAVPRDTQVLLEARSVRELASDLGKLRVLDASKLIGKEPFDDLAAALTNAFALPKGRSKELALALGGAGFAARKLESTPEAGIFVSASNASAINALLSLPRFKYQGLVAKNGRKYAVTPATAPPPPQANALEGALFALRVDGQSSTLVWFETSKILFLGSPSLAEPVARVLSLDVPGLEQSLTFQTARPSSKAEPNLFGYFDASRLIIEHQLASWLPSDANHLGAFAGSFSLLPEGIATHLVAHARVGSNTEAVVPLDLARRLPAETLAYAAFSMESGTPGAERERELLQRLSQIDARAAAQAQAALTELDAQFSVKISDFLATFGDRAATALIVPEGASLALGEPRLMARGVALAQLFAIKDEAMLRAALKSAFASAKLAPGLIAANEAADGIALTTVDGSLSAQARLAGGFGIVAVGGAGPVARAMQAFTLGENTLDAQVAYHTARSVNSSPTLLDIWVDAGRLLALARNDWLLAPSPYGSELDWVNLLPTVGPGRVTAGFGLSRVPGAAGLDYHVDGLNLPLLALLAARETR